jgi:hypothetical protein
MPNSGLAAPDLCSRMRSIIEDLPNMTPAEQANWQRLLPMESMSALRELSGASLPMTERTALATTLTSEVVKEIVRLWNAREKKAAKKLHNDLIGSINNLNLDEAILTEFAYNLFTDTAFLTILRTEKFAGRGDFAASLARRMRLHIHTKHNPKSSRTWMRFFSSLFFGRRNEYEPFAGFGRSTTLNLVGIAAVLSIQNYFFTLADKVRTGDTTAFEEGQLVVSTGAGWVHRLHGHPSIGWGVYYDKAKVEELLGADFQSVKQQLLQLRRFKADSREIYATEDRLFRVLQEKLYGGFTHWLASEDNSKPRAQHLATSASAILDSPDGAVGIAQQKVVILLTVLRDLGVKAHTEGGVVRRIGGDEEHVWIRLDDRAVVLDPTWNLNLDANRFYERYVIDGPHRVEPDYSNIGNNLIFPKETGQ